MRYTGTSLLTATSADSALNECMRYTERVYVVHKERVQAMHTKRITRREWCAMRASLCVSQAAMRSKQECDFWCARAACNSQNTGVQEGKAGLDAKQCAKEYRVAAKGEHNI